MLLILVSSNFKVVFMQPLPIFIYQEMQNEKKLIDPDLIMKTTHLDSEH